MLGVTITECLCWDNCTNKVETAKGACEGGYSGVPTPQRVQGKKPVIAGIKYNNNVIYFISYSAI